MATTRRKHDKNLFSSAGLVYCQMKSISQSASQPASQPYGTRKINDVTWRSGSVSWILSRRCLQMFWSLISRAFRAATTFFNQMIYIDILYLHIYILYKYLWLYLACHTYVQKYLSIVKRLTHIMIVCDANVLIDISPNCTNIYASFTTCDAFWQLMNDKS